MTRSLWPPRRLGEFARSAGEGWRCGVAVISLVVAGCSAAAPPPTPVPTPVPTPTVVGTPVPTLDPATADVQDAFITNVNDLTSDIETLATANCTDLVAETRANPTEVAQMRGYAATLQRLGANQAMLQSDDVRSALDALDHALKQLDTALSTCGVAQ